MISLKAFQSVSTIAVITVIHFPVIQNSESLSTKTTWLTKMILSMTTNNCALRYEQFFRSSKWLFLQPFLIMTKYGILDIWGRTNIHALNQRINILIKCAIVTETIQVIKVLMSFQRTRY